MAVPLAISLTKQATATPSPQAARKSAVQNYAERMVSSHHKTYGTALLIKYVKTSWAAKKVSVCYRTEELKNGA